MLLHAVIRNNNVVSIPPLSHRVTSSATTFARGGSCMTRPTGESIKRQHIFSRLIAACLTRALCCYLQASTFIPTQCDTSQVPPLPPPRWFRSCPFLSGFYPKASVGDRIILRVVINCISYFLLCTSTVPLALSAGRLSCEILEASKK